MEKVEEGVFMDKSEIRKQVDESNHEARRKKRMILFNLKMNKENNDREEVVEMIENMGVRMREEEIIYVMRMRKKEGEEINKPIIVEFQS